ncbi:STM3941 family protein [Bacillus sp. FSL K6-3431]|uniref:STM3941 family protein n=1 Tax=Bacillus sp. FSL K6-3431 TaxID=2921500 RepID=UPI0030FAEF4B
MNDFIVYPKVRRIVMLGLASFLFLLLGILFYILSSGDPGTGGLLLKIIGVITGVIFGLCLIYYINVLIKRKPALIVSNEGIFDQSSFIGAGLVKWEEIEDIDFIYFSGQLFLGIKTQDPNLIVNRSNGIKRVLNKLNKGLVEAQVNIPVKILSCSMDELVNEIENHWQSVSASNYN